MDDLPIPSDSSAARPPIPEALLLRQIILVPHIQPAPVPYREAHRRQCKALARALAVKLTRRISHR